MGRSDWGFIILLVVVYGFLIVQCYHPGPTLTERTRVFYDCRVAEISPDVPPLVKEECRKLQEKNNAR